MPVPVLRSRDNVIMDNLSSHKVAGVKAAIEGAVTADNMGQQREDVMK